MVTKPSREGRAGERQCLDSLRGGGLVEAVFRAICHSPFVFAIVALLVVAGLSHPLQGNCGHHGVHDLAAHCCPSTPAHDAEKETPAADGDSEGGTHGPCCGHLCTLAVAPGATPFAAGELREIAVLSPAREVAPEAPGEGIEHPPQLS